MKNEKNRVKVDVYFATRPNLYDNGFRRSTFITIEIDKIDYDKYIIDGAIGWEDVENCDWKMELEKSAYKLFKLENGDSKDWLIDSLEYSEDNEILGSDNDI